MGFLTARLPAGAVLRKLREADRLLAAGKNNAEVAKALEVTWTMSHWREQYGGLWSDDSLSAGRAFRPLLSAT